jgi:hypothetical protein
LATSVIEKTSQSKRGPGRLKIAQSGHPVSSDQGQLKKKKRKLGFPRRKIRKKLSQRKKRNQGLLERRWPFLLSKAQP